MMNHIFTFAVGVAAGVALEKILSKRNESLVSERAETLRACFGDPMCTTQLTLSEVCDWIKARTDQLTNGAKAVVVKANSDTLKNVGKEMNIDGVDNYLVIAIVDSEKKIADSILIKYEKIAPDLENELAKGNGVLVVEG